jgi:hypothetical protein
MHMQHIIMRTRSNLIAVLSVLSAALREMQLQDYASHGSSDFPKCP